MSIAESLSGFNIAVVDLDDSMRSHLEQGLWTGANVRAESYATIDEFFAAAAPGKPAVLVVGASYADATGMAQIASLGKPRPEIAVVMVAPELSTALLKQAIRSGVNDVIQLDPDPTPLVDAVQVASQTVAPAAPAAKAASTKRGKVISVFAPKGGSGKSFVATNLAVALAKRGAGTVALLDSNLQFGDAAIMLRLTPRHTVIDAVQEIDRLDGPLLQSLLVRHEQSGVLVLPAPNEPAFAGQVSADHMTRVISVMRAFADYVIVDTSSHVDDLLLATLDASDETVMVASMDVPNIKNVKLSLQTFRLLEMPTERIKFVINRANSKVGIDINEIEKSLGVKAIALIPSDIVVPQSVNKGVPVFLDSPRSGAAKSIDALAQVMVQSEQKSRR